jgi:hypothetical protein
MKFRKKPVVVEAQQLFTYHDAPRIVEWIESCGGKATYGQQKNGPVEVLISTLEGVMRADIGDWIIKGVNGEFYPCKPDIFKATYEPVPDVSFGSAHRANAPAILPPDGRSA